MHPTLVVTVEIGDSNIPQELLLSACRASRGGAGAAHTPRTCGAVALWAGGTGDGVVLPWSQSFIVVRLP